MTLIAKGGVCSTRSFLLCGGRCGRGWGGTGGRRWCFIPGNTRRIPWLIPWRARHVSRSWRCRWGGGLMSFIPPPKSFPITRRGQWGGRREVVPGGPSVSWRMSISLPRGQNRGGGNRLLFLKKKIFFSSAFYNTCLFSRRRRGLCPDPMVRHTFSPRRIVLQQQQVCEDALMSSAVKMQSNC